MFWDYIFFLRSAPQFSSLKAKDKFHKIALYITNLYITNLYITRLKGRGCPKNAPKFNTYYLNGPLSHKREIGDKNNPHTCITKAVSFVRQTSVWDVVLFCFEHKLKLSCNSRFHFFMRKTLVATQLNTHIYCLL